MNTNTLKFIKITLRIFFFIVSTAALIRLIWMITHIGKYSLQMDLSAVYAAGKSLLYGFDPYVNNLIKDIECWDGTAAFTHSRFIYTPLIAGIFKGFALLPYLVTKHIWLLSSISSMLISLLISMKTIKLKKTPEILLFLFSFTIFFFPVQTCLERGQINWVILLLVASSVYYMVRAGHNNIIAGVLLAAATMVKIYFLFLLPFLILRKKRDIIKGYILGGVIFFLFSLVFAGLEIHYDYFFKHLPRSAERNEEGTKAERLPKEARMYIKSFPQGRTVLNGKSYYLEVLPCNHSASLTQEFFPLNPKKRLFGLNSGKGSLIIFSILFSIMFIWHLRKRGMFAKLNPLQELIFWQIALIIILLSVPMAWNMNFIWVLPVSCILIKKCQSIEKKQQLAYILLCILGLLMIGLPDTMIPFQRLLGRANRYIYGGFALLIGLMNLINDNSRKFAQRN